MLPLIFTKKKKVLVTYFLKKLKVIKNKVLKVLKKEIKKFKKLKKSSFFVEQLFRAIAKKYHLLKSQIPYKLRTRFSPVCPVQSVLEGCHFYSVFQFFKNHIQKLLRILLNRNIHGLAHDFKTKTEIRWIKIHSITCFHITKHFLKLM